MQFNQLKICKYFSLFFFLFFDIMLIMPTIDDLPSEGIPYIIEKIMDSSAKNIHILNVYTKKGRVEYIILVDFEEKIFG